MKTIYCGALFLLAAFSAAAQVGSPLPSTSFTRDVLRATNAPDFMARAGLSTNLTFTNLNGLPIDHTTGLNADMTAALGATNGVLVKGVFYADLTTAVNSAPSGSTLQLFGTLAFTNQLILTNLTVKAHGATVLNFYTNTLDGLEVGIVPYEGSQWLGGTISNAFPGYYQAALGYDFRNGDPTCTNAVIDGVKIIGDTDGICFLSTNGFATVIVRNNEVNSRYDALIAGSTGFLNFSGNTWKTDGSSSVAGAIGRAAVLMGGNTKFTGDKFIAVSNAQSAVRILKQSTFYPPATGTNVFDACEAFTAPTNTATTYCVYVNDIGLECQWRGGLIDGSLFGGSDLRGVNSSLGAVVRLDYVSVMPEKTNYQCNSSGFSSPKIYIRGGDVLPSRLTGTIANYTWAKSGYFQSDGLVSSKTNLWTTTDLITNGQHAFWVSNGTLRVSIRVSGSVVDSLVNLTP